MFVVIVPEAATDASPVPEVAPEAVVETTPAPGTTEVSPEAVTGVLKAAEVTFPRRKPLPRPRDLVHHQGGECRQSGDLLLREGGFCQAYARTIPRSSDFRPLCMHLRGVRVAERTLVGQLKRVWANNANVII